MLRGYRSYDALAVSMESAFVNKGEEIVVQSHKDECDINSIVRKFGVTGQLPQGARMPTYQVFNGVFDYQSAMNAIVEADRAFMSLDADVRARFRNDPQRFVEFCSDPKNAEDLAKMGLAVPRETVDTSPAPDVPARKEKSDVKRNTKGGADKGASAPKGSEGDSVPE